MTENYIPNSVKQIIDEFISLGFRPYTYKMLADRLDVESNTLFQRINRNPEYFEIIGDRPKIITLKKDVEEVYFHRDKNTCQICQKKKNSSELLIRFKDPYLEEKNKLNNLHDWNDMLYVYRCQYWQQHGKPYTPNKKDLEAIRKGYDISLYPPEFTPDPIVVADKIIEKEQNELERLNSITLALQSRRY